MCTADRCAWWIWRTYYLFQTPRLERRLRVMMDWTVALLFRNDVVKLDLFGEQHPTKTPDNRIKDLTQTPAEVVTR